MLPLDRTALAVSASLCLLIGGVLWAGDQTYPRVRDFSWQDQQIGIDDQAFILTFNRPMDWDTVAANLKLDPPLPGKLSWSGRRLAYTLTAPIPYGQTFRVDLADAQAIHRGPAKNRRPMQRFQGEFSSRDRALVYLGVAGSENGRLILNNFSQNTQQVLTPQHLNVLDFKVNPGQQRVVFTAIPRHQPGVTLYDAQLYAAPLPATDQQPAPDDNLPMQQLLDNRSHQILDFDVQPYGDTIIVQRFGLGETGQIKLWTLDLDNQLQKIDYDTDGSTFQITPDGDTVAVSLNQGVAIVPLQPIVGQDPRFLSEFSRPLGFARDGSAALMARKNPDQTRSLFWVPNQGPAQELLATAVYLFDAQIDLSTQTVYCLYSRFNPEAEFRSDLHLSAIDLTTGKEQSIAVFPNQLSGHFSLSPDGSEIVYEQIQVTDQRHPSVVRNLLGQTITNSRIWRLPLKTNGISQPLKMRQPQPIGTGIKAQWIP